MTDSASLSGRPKVTGFFEARTFSVQYVVADPETEELRDHRPGAGLRSEVGGNCHALGGCRSLDTCAMRATHLEWILDTHPHADHFSAAGYLKDKTGVPTAIGEKVVEVQKLWKALYNYPDSFPNRRLAVGQAVCRWRALQDRQSGCRGDVHAWTHPGLDRLPCWRRGLHPRHVVHARRWNRARRLPRWQRRVCCGAASSASWRCRTGRASSLATTTCLVGESRGGRARSQQQKSREHSPHQGEDGSGVRRYSREARPRACRCPSLSSTRFR